MSQLDLAYMLTLSKVKNVKITPHNHPPKNEIHSQKVFLKVFQVKF